MASCKDCLCGDVCSIAEVMGENYCCPDCKDRNRFVELPCKVGDTVYIIPTTENCLKEITKAKCISFAISGVSDAANLLVCGTSKLYFAGFNLFGKTVFLTREEAERALKERENNG